MPTTKQLNRLALVLGECLIANKLFLATAESCTGGGIAYYITQIPGSSAWFERGFITYSNQAKEDLLGVSKLILKKYGAVSEATAQAMAKGALKNSLAQISIAVTGIAGPDGGTAKKPVGTVWFSWASTYFKTQTHCVHFKGTRQKIREQCIAYALRELIKLIKNKKIKN